MKVSEAREKVCPFMSIGFVADSGEFRSSALVEVTCVCGECMAWEYTKVVKETDVINVHKEEYQKISQSPSNRSVTEEHMIVEDKRYGEYGQFQDTRYAVLIALGEDEKEGYCKRIDND